MFSRCALRVISYRFPRSHLCTHIDRSESFTEESLCVHLVLLRTLCRLCNAEGLSLLQPLKRSFIPLVLMAVARVYRIVIELGYLTHTNTDTRTAICIEVLVSLTRQGLCDRPEPAIANLLASNEGYAYYAMDRIFRCVEIHL